MNVQFNDRHGLLSTSGVEQTQRRLDSALSKFGYRIGRVEITVKDSHGTRGGTESQCQILVKLNGLEDVFTTVTDESISMAISKAIRSSRRAVEKRIGRSKPLARQARGGLRFATNE